MVINGVRLFSLILLQSTCWMQLTHTLIFRKFVIQFADKRLFKLFFGFFILNRRGVRVVEGARLESVYTPKGYRGFESPSLRFIEVNSVKNSAGEQ